MMYIANLCLRALFHILVRQFPYPRVPLSPDTLALPLSGVLEHKGNCSSDFREPNHSIPNNIMKTTGYQLY